MDGNGIRDFGVLLRFFRRCPHAFYDRPLLESYYHLLMPDLVDPLLAVFDAEGSSEACLRAVAARRNPSQPPPEVLKHLARLHLRVLCDHPEWTTKLNTVNMDVLRATAEVVLLAEDAKEAGLTYTYCVGCTAFNKAGLAVDKVCNRIAMGIHEGQWKPAACSAMQLLRGRELADEAVARKFARGMVALQAAHGPPVGREPYRGTAGGGRSCDSPACNAQEPYGGAFKLCANCKKRRYCCLVCQARARASRAAHRLRCPMSPRSALTGRCTSGSASRGRQPERKARMAASRDGTLLLTLLASTRGALEALRALVGTTVAFVSRQSA